MVAISWHGLMADILWPLSQSDLWYIALCNDPVSYNKPYAALLSLIPLLLYSMFMVLYVQFKLNNHRIPMVFRSVRIHDTFINLKVCHSLLLISSCFSLLMFLLIQSKIP